VTKTCTFREPLEKALYLAREVSAKMHRDPNSFVPVDIVRAVEKRDFPRIRLNKPLKLFVLFRGFTRLPAAMRDDVPKFFQMAKVLPGRVLLHIHRRYPLQIDCCWLKAMPPDLYWPKDRTMNPTGYFSVGEKLCFDDRVEKDDDRVCCEHRNQVLNFAS